MASSSTGLSGKGSGASVSIDAYASGSTIYATATLNNGYCAWDLNSSPTLKIYIDGSEVASLVIKQMGLNNNWYTTKSVSGNKSVGNGNHTVTASWESPGGWAPSSGSASVSVNVNYNPVSYYTISFNANGGSGAPSSITKASNVSSVTIPTTKPTRDGYVFKCWNTNSSGTGTNYYSGGAYSENTSRTLYAIWDVNTYTISLNANGGEGDSTFTINSNQSSVNLPSSVPTRYEYKFKCWNTKADGKGDNYYAGGTWSIKKDTTLYAQWIYVGGLIRKYVNNQWKTYEVYVYRNKAWKRCDAYIYQNGWKKGKPL